MLLPTTSDRTLDGEEEEKFQIILKLGMCMRVSSARTMLDHGLNWPISLCRRSDYSTKSMYANEKERRRVSIDRAEHDVSSPKWIMWSEPKYRNRAVCIYIWQTHPPQSILRIIDYSGLAIWSKVGQLLSDTSRKLRCIYQTYFAY